MTLTDADTLAARAPAQWFLDVLRARRTVTAEEVADHFTEDFVGMVSAAGLADGITKMAVGLKLVEPVGADDGDLLRIPLSPTGGHAPFRVRIGVGEERLFHLDFGPLEIEGLTLWSQPPSELPPDDRVSVHAVFDDAYRNADHTYLDEQLDTLGTIACARTADRLVAFALSDARIGDLPGLPAQVVRTAGLSCTANDHRRQGISSRLESLAMTGGDAPAVLHTVLTSRFAHPAGIHYLRSRPDIVPRVGHTPTAWQREVAAGVAGLLGVVEFDPETFVCRGRGRPVGDNVIEVEVPEAEQDLFRHVDRSRGDTLLAVWWTTPPPGWG